MNLEAENQQVLFLLQALLGAISPNFRRISLVLDSSREVTVFFLLETRRADDLEEIQDIMFEFDALQIDSGVGINHEVLVLEEHDGCIPTIPGRLVFSIKTID